MAEINPSGTVIPDVVAESYELLSEAQRSVVVYADRQAFGRVLPAIASVLIVLGAILAGYDVTIQDLTVLQALTSPLSLVLLAVCALATLGFEWYVWRVAPMDRAAARLVVSDPRSESVARAMREYHQARGWMPVDGTAPSVPWDAVANQWDALAGTLRNDGQLGDVLPLDDRRSHAERVRARATRDAWLLSRVVELDMPGASNGTRDGKDVSGGPPTEAARAAKARSASTVGNS